MDIDQATQEPLLFKLLENDDNDDDSAQLNMPAVQELHQETVLEEKKKRRLSQNTTDVEREEEMNPKKKIRSVRPLLSDYVNGLMQRNNIPRTIEKVVHSLDEDGNDGEKRSEKNQVTISSKKTSSEENASKTREKPTAVQTLVTKYMPPVKMNKLVDFEKHLYTKKHWKALHYILVWFNYTIIERMFHKQYAGLYLWSYGKTVGKTLLCSVISKIINCYWWVFEDEGWQQDWDERKRYKCIVYNALNSNLLEHRQIEMHGDRKPIPVKRRNQRVCGHIEAETPFIITSNKPPEELGYGASNADIEVWTERMLIVCVDGCPLWDLIEQMKKRYNIVMEKEPPKPKLKHRRI